MMALGSHTVHGITTEQQAHGAMSSHHRSHLLLLLLLAGRKRNARVLALLLLLLLQAHLRVALQHLATCSRHQHNQLLVRAPFPRRQLQPQRRR